MKFSVSRLIGILLKVLFVYIYLKFKSLNTNFAFLKTIKDTENQTEYFVHPSNKEFQKTLGISGLIFFISNNCERMLQIKLFTNSQLGFFGFISGIGDNLHLMLTAPFLEFTANLFNLKFNLYWSCKTEESRTASLAEIMRVYFNGLKYALIFFQTLFVYASYMLLDKSSFFIFGKLSFIVAQAFSSSQSSCL